MNYYVLTLFPEMIEQGLGTSILGRAQKRGAIRLKTVNIRDYAQNKHGHVDDYPYGGGAGMVMQPGPVYRACEAVEAEIGHPARVLYMTPQGRVFDQKLAKELGIGEITLTDILKELEKPARDPRDDMPKPILRSDVLEMKDLVPGMILKGTIRNIIDFGAFVDIGVHQDGLVHISEMTDRFIKHPLEVVKIGDIVDVEVLGVDIGKKRISLTMKVKK